jgi:DNA sulfur modification protein DndE
MNVKVLYRCCALVPAIALGLFTRANENIESCTVYHAHGGFTIGSEMSGGVRNIRVDNCTFLGTDIGLRFKSNRGHGARKEQV